MGHFVTPSQRSMPDRVYDKASGGPLMAEGDQLWRRKLSGGDKLQNLQWPTLQERRKSARLVLLYKVLHDLLIIPNPQDWLSANITPVFKKGNRSSPANYRPISLTSVLCKVMEHVIFHHIMSFFTSLNTLNPLQHGFRPNHSCQTQLVDFIDEIQ